MQNIDSERVIRPLAAFAAASAHRFEGTLIIIVRQRRLVLCKTALVKLNLTLEIVQSCQRI